MWRLKKGHNFVKMQYRVMKLDLHILIVTLHIYFKFQANSFPVSEIFKYILKFKNIF